MVKNYKLQITNYKKILFGNWKLLSVNSSYREAGYSLVEMLVVLVVFTILAIVTTQSLALSLRGTRKSESISQAKENVDFAMSTMERLLRNAQSVTCVGTTQIDYVDEYYQAGRFACTCSGSDCYIASGSASPRRITTNEVVLTCAGVFTCPPTPTPGVPAAILITLTGRDADSTGAEGAQVTSQSRVLLRTY